MQAVIQAARQAFKKRDQHQSLIDLILMISRKQVDYSQAVNICWTQMFTLNISGKENIENAKLFLFTIMCLMASSTISEPDKFLASTFPELSGVTLESEVKIFMASLIEIYSPAS